VLGHWLQSIAARSDAAHIGAFAVDAVSSVDLIDDATGGVSAVPGTLASHVHAPDVVVGWLNRVRLVPSLEQAWQDRDRLQEAESFMTPAGEWLGRGWLRIARGKAGEEGMLTREKAIGGLQAEIADLQVVVGDQLQNNAAGREALDALQLKLQEVQLEVNALHRRHSEVQGQAQSRGSSLSLMDDRQLAIATEASELQQQLEHDQATLRQVRSELDQLLESMASLKLDRDQLDQQRTELLNRRDAARTAVQLAREQRHELALKAESRRASLDSLRQSLQRMDTQVSQLQQRYLNLSEQVARGGHPAQDHSAEMAVLLQRRVETEQRLGQARAALEQLEASYREQDAARQSAVQKADEIRQQLERLRLQQQEVELNARELERQVGQLGGDVQALEESL
ncbi:MAG: hypothetical protein ACREO9_09355, partial [Lysobacterales bacterium]